MQMGPRVLGQSYVVCRRADYWVSLPFPTPLASVILFTPGFYSEEQAKGLNSSSLAPNALAKKPALCSLHFPIFDFQVSWERTGQTGCMAGLDPSSHSTQHKWNHLTLGVPFCKRQYFKMLSGWDPRCRRWIWWLLSHFGQFCYSYVSVTLSVGQDIRSERLKHSGEKSVCLSYLLFKNLEHQ